MDPPASALRAALPRRGTETRPLELADGAPLPCHRVHRAHAPPTLDDVAWRLAGLAMANLG